MAAQVESHNQRPVPPAAASSSSTMPTAMKTTTTLESVSLAMRARIDAFLAEPDVQQPGSSSSFSSAALLRDVQARVHVSMGVIEEALETYGSAHLSLSYNGGKDCLVLLVLILACLGRRCGPRSSGAAPHGREEAGGGGGMVASLTATKTAAAAAAAAAPPSPPPTTTTTIKSTTSSSPPPTAPAAPAGTSRAAAEIPFPEALQAVYVVSAHVFPEVDAFVAASARAYHLDVVRIALPMRAALEAYLAGGGSAGTSVAKKVENQREQQQQQPGAAAAAAATNHDGAGSWAGRAIQGRKFEQARRGGAEGHDENRDGAEKGPSAGDGEGEKTGSREAAKERSGAGRGARAGGAPGQGGEANGEEEKGGRERGEEDEEEEDKQGRDGSSGRAVRAVFVGTRRTDPHGERLTHFDRTDVDRGWPDFIRVHPVIDWHYAEIWAFIRHLGIPYCPLYDRGYTSLGGTTDTHPNPALRIPQDGFRSAYELMDDDEERLGRDS